MAEGIRIQYAQLISLLITALANEGVPSRIGMIEAEVMAEADLLGVPSHGVRMLPGLLNGLRAGIVTPNPQLKILRERAASCLVDGDNGPARFASAAAMQQATERARQFGVGACLLTRVGHWGRAHAYAFRAAQANMIGICMTNAIPNMLAWGSSKPLLANNPLAIAVPLGPDKEPIILDMAMSQAAMGKIGTYAREGKVAPDNWGLDAAGKPSNDPAAILASRKILPFGGHKGAGLAFMIELLTGALAGGLLSHEILQADKTGLDSGSSKLFIALDISAFAETERFEQKANDLISWLKAAEPELGIVLPGERGWQTRIKNLADGVPIHAEIAAQLERAGVKLE